MVKGDNGVWAGTTTRAVKPGALALQLHRRRRDDGRFAQRQRLTEPDAGAEHAVRAGRFLRDARRTARCGRDRALRGVGARTTRGARCTSTRRPDMRRARELPGAVSDSRRRRHRNLVVDGGARQQHPRQPAGGKEGPADDRRDALRLDAVGRSGDDLRRDKGSLQRRDDERHHPVRPGQLPHARDT